MDYVNKVMSSYNDILTHYENGGDFPFVILVADYYKNDLELVKHYLKWYFNNNISVKPGNDLIDNYFGNSFNFPPKEIMGHTKCSIIFNKFGQAFMVIGSSHNGDIAIDYPSGIIDLQQPYHVNLSNIIDKAIAIRVIEGATRAKLISYTDEDMVGIKLKKIKKKINKDYYITCGNSEQLTDVISKKIYINSLANNEEKLKWVEKLFFNGGVISLARSCWVSFGAKNSDGSKYGEIKYIEDFYSVCNHAYNNIIVLNVGGEKKVINFLSDTSLYHMGYINKKISNSNIEYYRQIEKYTFHPRWSAVKIKYLITSDGQSTFIIPEHAQVILLDLLSNHKFKIIDEVISEGMFDNVFYSRRTNVIEGNIERIIFGSKKNIIDYPMFDKKWRKI